jgi:DNA polymerase
MLRAIDGPDAGNSLAKAAERYGLGVKGDEVVNALGKGRLDFTAEELARYGEYCVNDVELTYELFKRIAAGFPPVEFRLIDLTIRMFTEPVLLLEKSDLSAHLAAVKEKKDKLMAAIEADKSVIMSNPQLAELLEKLGAEVPMKISPTTGSETHAFAKNDEEFKALLEHPNPKVQAVVAARLGVKSTLEETRTERFIKIADRGTLPIPLRYYAAHTGRWGGDDKVNMQNLPRKSPLKKAIRAPEGYCFIDCDSSQIEARTLAWLAGQEDLVEFFDKNNAEVAAGVEKEDMQYDPYKIMASQIYRVPVGEVTDDQRFVGKTTILGAGYCMGAEKFQAQLKTFGVHMKLGECRRIVSVYRETYPKIPELWSQAGDALDNMIINKTPELGREGVLVVHGKAGIELPNGLRLRYDNLRWVRQKDGKSELIYDTKKGKNVVPTRIYGGKMVENICQALARIVIGEQMLMVARRYRVVMTVHDAVGAIAPVEEAGEARSFIEQCMRIRPKWAAGLPLNCESKIGASYGG